MANFLSAVGPAGWLTASLFCLFLPASGEFSHRIHLAQKIDRVVCHTAAPASVKAQDNLLPQSTVCLGCHTGDRALRSPVAIKSPRQSLVSKFNHQSHLKMGNIGALIVRAIDAKTYLSDPGDLRAQLAGVSHPCMSCHRGLQTSDAVTPAVFPKMADCLVCHNSIDPPFTCSKCHEPTASLKPASHSPGFIDRHSSGKANLDKTTCAVCHGRRFTCLGCH